MVNVTTSCDAYVGELSQVCAASQLVLFMSIINNFILKNYNQTQFCDTKPSAIPVSYDFIVVGGGTSGAVAASRLSENPDWSVLLIEAGPEEPLSTLVPSMVASYLGSDLDWKYTTVNESNACLSSGGSCYWPRGKNLGGCSVHNGMMYTRGHPKDYDNWNIPGWSWKHVLPYFMKSENNREIGRVNQTYHGTSGPIPVERFPWQPPITQDILDAAKEANLPVSEDLNGEQITGFSVTQTFNDKGLRVSSATAFLRPAHNRTNLHVLLNATVTEVLTANRLTIGVKYYKDGQERIAFSRKEVILSAGTIGSPQILLLSGIGPRKHLLDNKVRFVKDLPGVGSNLQNHVSFELAFTVNDTETQLKEDIINEYIQKRSGPLSSTGLSQITGIISSNFTTPDHPDLQFFFGGYLTACSDDTEGSETRYFGIKPVYLHTESRGTIRLASNNPFDYPIIKQNYLTREKDIRGLVEGIKIALSLANTKALQKYNITLISPISPACKHHEYMSKKYWRCAISQDTLPENHQSGSCKMGRPWDPYAVVDSRLRVYGIKGLRVADMSITPKIVSGNTAGPAIMIGERVADFIKQEYRLKRRPKKYSDDLEEEEVEEKENHDHKY